MSTSRVAEETDFFGRVLDRAAAAAVGWCASAVIGIVFLALRDGLQAADVASLLGISAGLIYFCGLLPWLALELVLAPRRGQLSWRRVALIAGVMVCLFPGLAAGYLGGDGIELTAAIAGLTVVALLAALAAQWLALQLSRPARRIASWSTPLGLTLVMAWALAVAG